MQETKPELIIVGDGVPDIKMEILSFDELITDSEIVESLEQLERAGINASEAMRELRQAFGTLQTGMDGSEFVALLENIERSQLDKLMKEDKRPYYRRFSNRKW